MRCFFALLILFLSGAAADVLRSAASSTGESRIPLSIEIVPAKASADMPALQSFAHASWNGKWIFIGGRTNGYHQTGGKDTDFSRLQANTEIWVVDNAAEPPRVYHVPVSKLSGRLAAVRDQWTASNFPSFQDGDVLYIAGGYGENNAHDWVTYPILSAVNLPRLLDYVIHGKGTIDEAVSYTVSPLVQSAGGSLIKLTDGFYLAMGHVFTGTYSRFEANNETNQLKVSQEYLGEIRKLNVDLNPADRTLKVALERTYQDPQFKRRDFNLTFAILPDNRTVGAAVYGGVFTSEQLNYDKPVYWGPGQKPWVDQAFEQKMSAYNCPTLQVFDPLAQAMYTTFFGGISRWFWSNERNAFERFPMVGDKTKETYFDGLEWTNQISTLVRHDSGTSEFVQPKTRLPGFLGTEAVFFPSSGVRPYVPGTDIFDMTEFRHGRTLAGYIYGGIEAFPKRFPYSEKAATYRPGTVPTRSSSKLFSVYVEAR